MRIRPLGREFGRFGDTQDGVRPRQGFGGLLTIRVSDHLIDVQVWVSDSLSGVQAMGQGRVPRYGR